MKRAASSRKGAAGSSARKGARSVASRASAPSPARRAAAKPRAAAKKAKAGKATPARPASPHHGATPAPTPQALLARLVRHGLHIAVAESCTGGLVAARITDAPGASAAFVGGIVAYDDRVKSRQLGVDAVLFGDGHGAVSAAVAQAMAEGARTFLGADIAVSVSGIAGPGGGSPGKPVGTVWLACVGPGQLVHVHRIQAAGTRAQVRSAAVAEALGLVARALDEAEREGLLPPGTYQ